MNPTGAALLSVLLVAGAAAAEDNGAAPPSCGAGGLQVQALSAGGAERAGGGYLVWIDGRARALIDLGLGAALRFEQSGARAKDLDVVLFTRLHADRTLGFPALVAAGLREGRQRPLPLYGPVGSRFAPSTVTFVRTLLDGTRGVYRHLGSVLSPLTQHGFKLEPHDVRTPPARMGVRRNNSDILPVYRDDRLQVQAAYLADGAIPALAWRLQTQDRRIVLTGSTNGGTRLERLARGADLLIVDTPKSDDAGQRAAAEAIGRLAASAQPKHVILPRRLGGRADAAAAVRTHYAGPLALAADLGCYPVP